MIFSGQGLSSPAALTPSVHSAPRNRLPFTRWRCAQAICRNRLDVLRAICLMRRGQAERTLKIIQDGLCAADRPLGEGRPVMVEQRHSTSYLDQLHRLVQTGAEQAPRRRAGGGGGGVPDEEPLLRLLQSRLVVRSVPQLQVRQELPEVVCRVGQARGVEIDQHWLARSGPHVFGLEVPVREGWWFPR